MHPDTEQWVLQESSSQGCHQCGERAAVGGDVLFDGPGEGDRASVRAG
jgi:hypothetical protein